MGLEVLLGTVLASFAVGGATLTITVGTVLTALTLAGSAYLTYQQQLAAKKAQRGLAGLIGSVGVGPEGQQFPSRSTTAPWQTVYGQTRKSGAVFFEHVQPPFYYLGFVLASHRIDSVVRTYMNGVPLDLDSNGDALNAPYAIGTRRLLRVSIRLGTDDQPVDPIIAALAPSLPAGDPAKDPEFRQRGHATMVVRMDYGANDDEWRSVWSDGQNPTALIRGKRVYDPRDPTQSRDDASTWKWSDAPTLVAGDLMRSQDHGRVSADLIKWSSNARGAAIDNEMTLTKSGALERRYVCNGVIDTTSSAVDALRTILACNRGRLAWTGDGYSIQSGRVNDPVFTIHQAIVRGGIEYRTDVPRDRLVNTVRTRIVRPDKDYQVDEGPMYIRSDLVTSDGAPFELTLDLPLSEGTSRAQRLAKAALETARLGRSLRMTLEIEAIVLEPGDVVRVDIASLPWVNGLYVVERCGFTEDFAGIFVDIAETSTAIDAFNPATDEV